jgi:nitrogenase molybdenum-iron protein NifN
MPFHRAGLPMFDRLGAGQHMTVGYRGTRDFIFEIGNIFLGHPHEATPDSWRLPETCHEDDAAVAAH